MTRQEREMAKKIEKELKLTLKNVAKINKWSFKDSIIFKAENGLFFECMVGYNKITKNVDVRLSFKPIDLDDLFWDIFDLTENKKQPLSFRSFGVFTVSTFEIHKWQEKFIYTEGHLDEFCNNIIQSVQKRINEVLLSVHDISAYITYLKQLYLEHQSKYPGSVVDINLEIILSFILLNKIEDALSIVNNRLKSGDKGRYLDGRNTLKGIYDYTKEYCENKILK